METVLGVPDVVLDGDTGKIQDPNAYTGYPLDLTQSLLNSEGTITSPVSMTATYNYDSLTDSVFSTIVVKNVSGAILTASASDSLKLFINLLEMNIHFVTNPPGDNGEFDFYYVTRKMYPSANGFILPDTMQNGDSVIYQLSVKAPSYIYNTKQMAIASFVQDMGTMTVHQAVLATPANVTDMIMADNTTYPAATEVCNVSFSPSLTLTNNGSDTLTSATVGYVIPGDTAISQPWTGSLAPGQSSTIALATVTLPDYTYSTFNYFVNNLNGGALIDVNDANNYPQTPFFSTVNTVAAMDSLSEQFEEGLLNSVSTYISTNSTDPNDAFGFIADLNFINEYIYTASGTDPIGGYGLSDASFFYCLPCADNPGSQDGLIFYKVDRTGLTDSLMTFDHAYAGYQSNDQLQVLISTDCGDTWNTVWNKAGADLSTSPDVNWNDAIFTPSKTQWVTDTVDVSAYNNNSGVIIQFLATSQYGNALYIDNINWGLNNAPAGIVRLSNTVSASVYPNPAADQVNLALTLAETGQFDVSIVNTLGQNIKTVHEGELAAGLDNLEVNVADLASGLYNFVIKSNDQVLVKRFFVAK
jgi:hypothetical protein